MGQILKFPGRASKFGYKSVRKCSKTAEHPDQLQLFPRSTAKILHLASSSSHFESALLLDERGDPQAIDFYLKAIAEKDCVADAYCNLGIIESKRGGTAKAFDCFTRSLQENPRHFEAHYNLANMYSDVNDLRLAQIHYEMAAEIEPTFANLYFNLALVLSMNQELSAAISALSKYQDLVSPEEGRKADELLQNLKKSVAAEVDAQSRPG